MKSPFSYGCQTYLDKNVIPNCNTPILLKRSCFICEESLNASFGDGLKTIYKIFNKPTNKYGIIYGNGKFSNKWK